MLKLMLTRQPRRTKSGKSLPWFLEKYPSSGICSAAKPKRDDEQAEKGAGLDKATKAAVFLIMTAVVAACGSSQQPSASTPTGITVTGTYTLVDAGGGCGQSFDSVGGVQLTFKDGNGSVIGTATTGDETKS